MFSLHNRFAHVSIKLSSTFFSTLPIGSQGLLKENFRQRLEAAKIQALGENRAEKQHQRGKLTARERLCMYTR